MVLLYVCSTHIICIVSLVPCFKIYIITNLISALRFQVLNINADIDFETMLSRLRKHQLQSEVLAAIGNQKKDNPKLRPVLPNSIVPLNPTSGAEVTNISLNPTSETQAIKLRAARTSRILCCPAFQKYVSTKTIHIKEITEHALFFKALNDKTDTSIRRVQGIPICNIRLNRNVTNVVLQFLDDVIGHRQRLVEAPVSMRRNNLPRGSTFIRNYIRLNYSMITNIAAGKCLLLF